MPGIGAIDEATRGANIFGSLVCLQMIVIFALT